MRGPSSFQPTEGGANHVKTEPNQILKFLHRFVSLWWLQKGALQLSLTIWVLSRFGLSTSSCVLAGGRGPLLLLSRFFSTEVPTGTGGGALADLQVEIFVELTPLQPGHHRQHKVGLIIRPQEACRRFGLENVAKTPVVLRPLERRSHREIVLVFRCACVFRLEVASLGVE